MIRSNSFRKGEEEKRRIGEAERCGKEERHMNAPMTQDAANRWSKNESETKRSPDQPHAFRAILFGSDISNVSLCCRNVSACDAVEDATDEEHPECRGHPKD